jgi:hypothetical protein
MSTAVKLQESASYKARTSRLRELGIYEMPGGREFVVSTLYLDGCSLYPVRAWETFGNAEYWVNKEGKILSKGIPTGWGIQDLRDTGRSAAYPKPILH